MARQQIIPRQIRNPYRFRAYRAAAWTPVAASNTVPFDTKNYDPNNNFSTTTYKYTVPVTGLYFISGRSSVNANTRAIASINVNAAERARGTDNTGTAPTGVMVSTDLELTAGDEVTFVMYAAVSGSAEVDSIRTWFTGRLVSVG